MKFKNYFCPNNLVEIKKRDVSPVITDRLLCSGRSKRCSSLPKNPHHLWDPPSLLFNEYRVSLRGKVATT
jgi:hypothetical protein